MTCRDEALFTIVVAFVIEPAPVIVTLAEVAGNVIELTENAVSHVRVVSESTLMPTLCSAPGTTLPDQLPGVLRLLSPAAPVQ